MVTRTTVLAALAAIGAGMLFWASAPRAGTPAGEGGVESALLQARALATSPEAAGANLSSAVSGSEAPGKALASKQGAPATCLGVSGMGSGAPAKNLSAKASAPAANIGATSAGHGASAKTLPSEQGALATSLGVAGTGSRAPARALALDASIATARSGAATEDFDEEEMEEPYRLLPGSLSRQLEGWCARTGHVLVWKAGRDLEMETEASFEGGLVEALRALFNFLAESGHPFRVNIYSANNVVEVLGR